MALERLGSGINKRAGMRKPCPPEPALKPEPPDFVEQAAVARADWLLDLVQSYLNENAVDGRRQTDNDAIRVYCLERLAEWCARELQHERGTR